MCATTDAQLYILPEATGSIKNAENFLFLCGVVCFHVHSFIVCEPYNYVENVKMFGQVEGANDECLGVQRMSFFFKLISSIKKKLFFLFCATLKKYIL